jgi:hypothetical protein
MDYFKNIKVFNKSKQGELNTAGAKMYLFVTAHDDIQKFGLVGKFDASKPDGETNEVNISRPHEFKADKGFMALYSTQEKIKYEWKSIGEVDGKSFEQTLEVFLPSSSEMLSYIMARSANTQFIVLLVNNDIPVKVLQIGNYLSGAKIEDISGGLGTVKDGVRGHKIVFKAYSHAPEIYYPHPITVKGQTAPVNFNDGDFINID